MTILTFASKQIYTQGIEIYTSLLIHPHLIKTATNCLHNSGEGKHSRDMWNNEKYLLWEHIVKIYHEDLENGLKILPKISNEHVYLNSYSVMTVKYAV